MSSFNVQYKTPTLECFRPAILSNNGAPTTIPSSSSKEDLDAVLVQGMTHLSFEELQQEQEELHGVSSIIKKEKEELDELLKSFSGHLDRLKSGTAYEYAESMDKNYVCNQNFQLMFIRSNRYEPKASAEQAIRFFDMKMALFGKDKLAKDITLSDLDDDDKESLRKGSFQVLRKSDSSGRRILLEVPGLMSFKTVMNELRARFYVFMHIAKSANSIGNQGQVFLSYCVGEFRDQSNGAGFVEMTRLGLACPIHWSGLHLACDDRRDAIIAKAGIAIMPSRMKAKTKVHFGSHCECQYQLSTFGISLESLPFAQTTNEMILDDHLEWYESCLKREQSCVTPDQKNEPKSNDVLFAGRRINGDGNVLLRSMAMQHAQLYDDGSIKVRRTIVDSMVQSIQSNGGRFLKLDIDGSSWVEVSVPEVREKIVQMFRNFRRSRTTTQQKMATRPPSPPPPDKIVVTLREGDVVFGRQGHEGNQKLRNLIESMSAEYDEATRGQKKELVEDLMKSILQAGGRFLKQISPSTYEELSNETASAKIGSHFRNYRRIQRDRKD